MLQQPCPSPRSRLPVRLSQEGLLL